MGRLHRQTNQSSEVTLDENGIGTCNVCNIQLTSRQHSDQHLRGKKHNKERLRWQQGVNPQPKNLSLSTRSYCDVCNVPLSNLQQLEFHNTSPKHLKKVEQRRRVQEFKRYQ